jgi:hypothetical protein
MSWVNFCTVCMCMCMADRARAATGLRLSMLSTTFVGQHSLVFINWLLAAACHAYLYLNQFLGLLHMSCSTPWCTTCQDSRVTGYLLDAVSWQPGSCREVLLLLYVFKPSRQHVWTPACCMLCCWPSPLLERGMVGESQGQDQCPGLTCWLPTVFGVLSSMSERLCRARDQSNIETSQISPFTSCSYKGTAAACRLPKYRPEFTGYQ